ncbi:MAG: hypothetical protein ACLTVB_00885 [Sutterella sp.]
MKGLLKRLTYCVTSLTAQLILLALVGLTLNGCATPTPNYKPESNPIPEALMQKHLPDAQHYSQKVQDWLQRVKDFYESTEQNTTH